MYVLLFKTSAFIIRITQLQYIILTIREENETESLINIRRLPFMQFEIKSTLVDATKGSLSAFV